MQPLIDGDILVYEIGAIGDIDGPKHFDFVAEVLDGRIRDICTAVEATEEPIVYLTGSTNFRNAIAVSQPYKSTRKAEKPFHYKNIITYLNNQYDVRLTEGLEADDLMAIEQSKRDDTVICSRDKDLRMVPGWHYGWECGAQREFGPELVNAEGYLRIVPDKKPMKVQGVGELFFYYQMLVGDQVDTIPGCPGVGPVAAMKAFNKDDGLTPYQKVKALYEDKGLSEEYLLEQGRLLWMVRELDEDGGPVMWQPPS